MSKNRVLIIDDDQRICRLIKRVADGLGVESFVTDNPELFESAYLGYEPNVILMDLQMPKLDGIELLRKLAEYQSKAAIILASGMDKSVLETTEELGKSLGLNMFGFLNKPIDIDDVKKILEKQFDPVKERTTQTLIITEADLLQAIEQNELVVYYQPQIQLETGKVIGTEALVRWQHPEHGLLFPDSFIPLAESNKELIGLLTYAVMETALQDDMKRREKGIELNLSINLSANLLSDLTLPDKVEELLTTYRFDPNRLLLEVTESGAMENPLLTMDILTRLRLKNIRLSIDDFGTGFSSLVQLYRMPFNEIKVDKSFVMKAMTDKEAAAIARITIDLGHSLGLEVVAEGVEDQETYDWLKGLSCEIGQGYFISRPVDVDQFSDWLNKYNKP
ncbi:MAG: EAL domain-containing response regulator [Gammaproteobacteria bacterium]|jgi:EAL domain-containing protein (putative c-di-GMP-specific phosphodiesterase class I)/ActR/RegA family two-component response regulator|nr:EAL domain-containing protein [Gammaproteobacteria bacterium]